MFAGATALIIQILPYLNYFKFNPHPTMRFLKANWVILSPQTHGADLGALPSPG